MAAMTPKGAFGLANQEVSESPVLRPEAPPTSVPVLTSEITKRLEGVGQKSLPPPVMDEAPRSGIAALRERLQKAEPPPLVTPPRGEFVPGKRPEPTGPRAHELWNNPESRARLAEVVAKWEKANPGRKLKATHLVSAWNADHPETPLNEARARTVMSKVKAAQQEYLVSQVAGYLSNGAKKAVTK